MQSLKYFLKGSSKDVLPATTELRSCPGSSEVEKSGLDLQDDFALRRMQDSAMARWNNPSMDNSSSGSHRLQSDDIDMSPARFPSQRRNRANISGSSSHTRSTCRSQRSGRSAPRKVKSFDDTTPTDKASVSLDSTSIRRNRRSLAVPTSRNDVLVKTSQRTTRTTRDSCSPKRAGTERRSRPTPRPSRSTSGSTRDSTSAQQSPSSERRSRTTPRPSRTASGNNRDSTTSRERTTSNLRASESSESERATISSKQDSPDEKRKSSGSRKSDRKTKDVRSSSNRGRNSSQRCSSHVSSGSSKTTKEPVEPAEATEETTKESRRGRIQINKERRSGRSRSKSVTPVPTPSVPVRSSSQELGEPAEATQANTKEMRRGRSQINNKERRSGRIRSKSLSPVPTPSVPVRGPRKNDVMSRAA